MSRIQMLEWDILLCFGCCLFATTVRLALLSPSKCNSLLCFRHHPCHLCEVPDSPLHFGTPTFWVQNTMCRIDEDTWWWLKQLAPLQCAGLSTFAITICLVAPPAAISHQTLFAATVLFVALGAFSNHLLHTLEYCHLLTLNFLVCGCCCWCGLNDVVLF